MRQPDSRRRSRPVVENLLNSVWSTDGSATSTACPGRTGPTDGLQVSVPMPTVLSRTSDDRSR